MAATRTTLTVIDPTGQGGPANNGRYPFELVPKAKNKGRTYHLETRPWQPTDPKDRWRIPIHPFAAGMRLDKIFQHVSPYSGMLINRVPETYAAGPIDASPHGLVLPPPLVTAITLTNGTLPSKAVDFNGLKFLVGGRYMYYIDPTTNTATQDKDFGSGKAAVDACVFNGELIVAMGETEKIWKRTTAGTWTQATDATYAIALGVVQTQQGPNLLWRAETTNQLSNCTTTPLTLANWGPATKYTVGDGDSLYPVHTILSYGGTIWAINGKGAWQGDPNGRFKNQAPQMEQWPDPNNGKGAWMGGGYLWIPTLSGVLRLKSGESKPRGPELTGRPAFRWRVRGGVYFGSAHYLIADDLAAVGNTCIVKMYPDEQNITPDNHDYIYQHIADVSGTTTAGYFITVMVAGTNPTLLFGSGNNAAYITLSRGGTVTGLPDDPNYRWGTSATLNSGVMMPTMDMATVSNLVGTEIVCKVANAGESLTLSYSVDDTSYQNFVNTVEGGGIASISGTTDYQAVIRYADPNNCEGQQFQFRLSGALTTTSTRWEVREWWVFGYSHSKVTDVIDLAVIADDNVRPGGIGSGLDHDATLALWRGYVGSELQIEIEGYETGHRTRFVVSQVKEDEVDAFLDTGGQSQIVSAVSVTLIRVDRAGAYAS